MKRPPSVVVVVAAILGTAGVLFSTSSVGQQVLNDIQVKFGVFQQLVIERSGSRIEIDPSASKFPEGNLQIVGSLSGVARPVEAPVVFDSATTTSCTGRLAVAGDVSYCDASGTIRSVAATTDIVCGDGVRQTGEDCDGTDLGACTSCLTDCSCGPATTTTTLACSACSPTCGTGFTCNTTTCQCEPSSQPVADCGNGTIEGDEICDPGGKACTLQTDCGNTGTCTSSACVAMPGSCTYGCAGDCTCKPPPTCTGDYYVRKDGLDTNDGTEDTAAKAFLTINKAMTSALTDQDVDGTITVCVGSGVYNERIVPTITGTASTPLILKTISGAIIDPSVAATSWTQVSGDARFTNPYLYKLGGTAAKPYNQARPETLVIDDGVNGFRVVPKAGEDGLGGEWADWFNNGPHTCAEACCYPGCTRTASWTTTNLQWGYDTANATYLAFETNIAPSSLSIRVMPKWYGTITLSTTAPTAYLTIEGFTFRNNWSHIQFDTAYAASNVTIRGNTFYSWDNAIIASSTITTNVTIEDNLFDEKLYLKSGVTTSAADDNHWRVWQWVKRGDGGADRNAVYAPDGSPTAWTFRRNRVQNSHQGVAPGVSYDNWTVSDNSFENILDEAVDNAIGGGSITIRDNEVRNANNGFRLRARSGLTEVYRNRVHIDPLDAKEAEGFLIYLYGGTNATQRIYHNSMNGRSCIGLGSTTGWTNPIETIATLTNTWFVNNICSTQIGAESFGVDFVGDQARKNWWYVLPPSSTYSGTLGTGNLDSADGRYWTAADPGAWDIRTDWPTAGTDPKDAGIQINTTQTGYTGTPWSWTDDGRGYDATPDMGARQYLAGGTTTSTTTTTAASTTTTTSAKIDWATSLDMVLRMETGAVNTDAAGSCSWTNTGTGIVAVNTEYRQGSYAGESSVAGTEELISDCNATEYAAGSSFACGGWVRPLTVNSGTAGLIANASSNLGYILGWNAAGEDILWDTYNGVGDRCIARTVDAQAAAGSWHHIVGIFDNVNNRQWILLDGVQASIECSENCTEEGTTSNYCTQADIAQATANMRIFRNASGSGITGQMDEAFCGNFDPADTNADGDLDLESLCRICSCGIGMERCTCSGSEWVDPGWQDTVCNHCTLPTACNKATP